MGFLDRVLDRGHVGTLPNLGQRAVGDPLTGADARHGLAASTSQRQLDIGPRGAELNTTAQRCVSIISSNLGSLDIVVETPNGVLDNHPMATLLNRQPNPSWSARTLKEVVYARCEWEGEAFCFLDRGETGQGEVQGIWPMFLPVSPVVTGDRNAPEREQLTSRLLGYQVRMPGGGRAGLLASEVLWLRYPSPTSPWGCRAPWRNARFAAELDEYAKAWQLGELRNGGRPSGIVFMGDIDEDEFTKAKESWRARLEGAANAARHIFTAGKTPASYSRIGWSPAELSYIESRGANSGDVMEGFGMPRDYLRGGSTFDNQRTAKVGLWSDGLVPKMEVFAGEVDRQLLPDANQTAAFDVSDVDALNENQDAISTRVARLMNADVLLIDDGREQLGLPPLPGGLGQQTLTAYRQQLGVNAMGSQAAAAAQVLGGQQRARQRVTVSRLGMRRHSTVQAEHVRVRTLHLAQLTRPRARSQARTLTVAEVQRAYSRHEQLGRRTVARLAERMERVVLRQLRRQTRQRGADSTLQVRVTANDIYDDGYWRDTTREVLEAWVAGVWDDGGTRQAASLGVSFDLFDARVHHAMRSRLDVLADVVTATTRTALEEDLLAPGVAAGESIDALAERLQQRFTDLRTWRAETIARTETVGGFNAATRTVAVGSGQVQARTWLAASDDRVRDSHERLNGHTTQGLDDPYPNGLMHPGDPTGPAEETINCRCVETYVLTDQQDDGSGA